MGIPSCIENKKEVYNSVDILQFGINQGLIDFELLQNQMVEMKRNEILTNHNHKIWQGENGKWYTYLDDETKTRGIVLKKRNTQKDIEDLIIKYYEQKSEKKELTFDDVYFMWRELQDQLVSEPSVAKYKTDYTRFFYNTEFANTNIKDIKKKDIQIFMKKTIEKLNIGKETARKLFWYTKTVILHALEYEIISKNPAEFLKAKQFYQYCKEEHVEENKKVICDDEMKLLRERFQKDHEKNPNYIPTYAVEFASLTGMRVGEIAGLKWEHINYEKGYIVVQDSEKSNSKKNQFYIDDTKNRKTRYFPITDEIKKLLKKIESIEKEYDYLGEWVFMNEEGRIHTKTISSCSQTKARQLKINSTGIHKYRKTLNSKMKSVGVTTSMAATLLGHTEEVNNKHYTFDMIDIEEKIKIVSRVNEMTCAM